METLRIGCAAWTAGFYRTIKPRFSGAGLNSDTGLFPDRGLDETVRFNKSQAIDLFDFHTESDIWRSIKSLPIHSIRQRVFRKRQAGSCIPGGRDYMEPKIAAVLRSGDQERRLERGLSVKYHQPNVLMLS